MQDTARYTCIARNLAGETEKSFDLDVMVPPTIKEVWKELFKFCNGSLKKGASKHNLSVIISRPIVIDCPAEGIPPPTIDWLKVISIS